MLDRESLAWAGGEKGRKAKGRNRAIVVGARDQGSGWWVSVRGNSGVGCRLGRRESGWGGCCGCPLMTMTLWLGGGFATGLSSCGCRMTRAGGMADEGGGPGGRIFCGESLRGTSLEAEMSWSWLSLLWWRDSSTREPLLTDRLK